MTEFRKRCVEMHKTMLVITQSTVPPTAVRNVNSGYLSPF